MNTSQRSRLAVVAIVAGPVAAGVVAWATSTADTDISIANTALALAFVCVAAALASPLAGILTSAVAALGLNYFHTVPLHSLRMTEGDEVVTVLLLVLLGASVSVATTLRVRARVADHHDERSGAAGRELRALLAGGGSLPAAWRTAVDAACEQAGSIDVRLVSTLPPDLPVVSRQRNADDDAVVVPESGAGLVLVDAPGALVLTPQPGLGAITASRTTLLQFADQLGSALAGDDRARPAA